MLCELAAPMKRTSESHWFGGLSVGEGPSSKAMSSFPRSNDLFRYAPHHIKFVVRPHGGDVRHPVRQREERRNRGNIPNVVVAETVAGDLGKLRFRNPGRPGAPFH